MTDDPLITRLCDTIDTLSRGGAIEAIRIVREYDCKVEIERDPDWPKLAGDDHLKTCPCFRCESIRVRKNYRTGGSAK